MGRTVHKKDTFKYLGYHFTPILRLAGKESSFRVIGTHLSTDLMLGMSKYDWSKHPYDYEDFYKACGEKFFDIFHCAETGKTYIPGENELFIYE